MLKKNIKRFLLLFVSFIIFFCFAELLFRVFFDEPSNVIVRKNNEILMNFNKHTAINKSHPEEGNVYIETPAGRRLNPNIEAIIENHSLSKKRVVIKTNSIGYRNAEILPKTEKLRILFLGDSIIFGDYLNEEETIVKLTEIYLKNKDIQNETINAGIGSTGLANYLTVLTESGLKLQPNIVLICFYLNDFEQSPGVKMINPPKYLNWSWLGRLIYRNISILKSNYKNHNNISNRKIKICFEELKKQYNNPQKEFHKLIIANMRDWGLSWSSIAWQDSEKIFEEFKKLSIENSFKLMIAMFPVREQITIKDADDYPQKQMNRLCENMQIPYLDLLPILKKAVVDYNFEINNLFYDQCHHTPLGNEIIAKSIADFIYNSVK
ncbi:MAG TPA: hypothetical protein PLM75_10275 [bacterium]|nr:hypothetical protein [bacterium]